MDDSIQHHHADVGDVTLHYVTAGRGSPLVLLHGWPQTWRTWRRLIPRLADRFRIIAPDLRGLGESSLPPGGYDKRTIGEDVWRLVNGHLGIDRFDLVGHDWGGAVAFSIAIEHREAVRRLAILDMAIPGDGAPGINQGGRRWHHAFHQTPELPEQLVAGREAIYLGWFYDHYGHAPGVIDAEDIRHYVAAYSRPGRMAAGFALYRAIATDIADNQARLQRGRLAMPVLALGGDSAFGRRDEVEQSLRRVADHVRGGIVTQAGHWLPEEQPGQVADALRAFLDDPDPLAAPRPT